MSFPFQCDVANPADEGVLNKDKTSVGVKEC
jgi:hypothetical protein